MTTTRQTHETNLVFISHDHREQAVAQAVAEAIRDVSGGMLHTFYSSAKSAASGIEYGEEWFKKIKEKLSSATHIVCVLTPQSMLRPWIYFEAGFALGKHAEETPLVALLIGLDSAEVTLGPFAHFKFLNATKSDVAQLLREIAERADFAPTDSSVEAAAGNFMKKIRVYSAAQKGSYSAEALRGYRACIVHSKLTFGLLEYLNEHDKGDDREIAEWIKAQSHLSPSEAHRRRVLFALLGVGVLKSGPKRVGITKLGLLIYDNLVHGEKDPDPVPGELDVYRKLLNDMNFVPKILHLLFTEVQHKMSHNALMKIVRGDLESSELPRTQAEAGFSRVFEMLREAGVIKGQEGHTIQLTRRGHAMCCDLFGIQPVSQ